MIFMLGPGDRCDHAQARELGLADIVSMVRNVNTVTNPYTELRGGTRTP